MSNQYPTWFVDMFHNSVRLLQQQETSRLMRGCRVETAHGEKAFFDQLDSIEAVEITDRHGSSSSADVETPHKRRMVTPRQYAARELIDRADRVKAINDPQSGYAENFSMAFGRRKDINAIGNLFAVAATGRDGTGTSALSDNPNGYQVAVDYGPLATPANQGLTTPKLVEARRMLLQDENRQDQGFFVGTRSKQLAELLDELIVDSAGNAVQYSPASSADYVQKRSLMTGEIDFYMGFTFITSELITVDSSDYALCPAWAKNSMLMAFWQSDFTRIEKLPTVHYSTQVYHSAEFGSTRMDEKGMKQIICDQSIA